MKRIAAILIMTLIAVGSAFASVDAYIIPLGNEFYEDVDALYVMSGRSLPSTSRPWHWGEAERILSYLEVEKLNDSEKAIYEHARKELDELQPRWKPEDEWTIGVGLELNPEMYTHKNGDEFSIDTDWSYKYDDRPVFLKGYIDTGVSNWFYTYCELSYGISRYQRKDNLVGTDDKADIEAYNPDWYANGIGAILPPATRIDNNVIVEDPNDLDHHLIYVDGVVVDLRKGAYDPVLPKSTHLYSRKFSTNFPGMIDFKDIDFTTPKRAVFSVGGPSWNLMFGRERLNWGHSHIGNFTIDDHVGWHETLRFTANTKMFKYDCTNIFLETLPAMRETCIEDITSPGDELDAVPEFFKIYMNHRLEFNPWKPLRFAITESIMWKGKAFDVGAANPSFIYHQLNNRAMFNCLASLEIFLTPYKGLNIYTEFGLDNATLIFEGHSQADANGWLLGADYTHALGGGYIKGEVEFAHTSPVMYRRDEVDFLMVQRCYTLGGGNQNATPKLYYLGFPYGPDAEVLHLGISYRKPDSFEVGAFWNGVVKGSMDMFQSHNKGNNNSNEANIVGKTPTDGGSRDFELFIYGSYEIPHLPDWMALKLNANLAWVGKDGNVYKPKVGDEKEFDHARDIQFSLVVSLSI